jgi:hypothetical protein
MQKITLTADDSNDATVGSKTVTTADYTALKDMTFALTFKSKLNESFTTIPIPFYNFQVL